MEAKYELKMHKSQKSRTPAYLVLSSLLRIGASMTVKVLMAIVKQACVHPSVSSYRG